MLTLLASMLGIGGVAGIALRFLAPGLLSKGLGLLDRLPGWLVYGLAGALALGGVWLWHSHAVTVAHRTGVAEGRKAAAKDWHAAFDTMHGAALTWRTAYEASSASISNRLREKNDADLADNARLADALGLRGPGQAAARCGPVRAAGVASAAGGREPAPARPDAPGSAVPAGDEFAIVPWPWLVERAREHDDLLAEAEAWRKADADHRDAYADAVARLKAVKVLPSEASPPD